MRLIDRGLQAILPEGDSAGTSLAWMAGAVAAAVGLGLMVKGGNGRVVELSQVPAFRLDRENGNRLLAAWRGDMHLSGEIEWHLELSEEDRAVLADALLERGDPIGPVLALELQRAPYVLIEDRAGYDDELRCECRNVMMEDPLEDPQGHSVTDAGVMLDNLETAVLASGTLTANEAAAVRTAVENRRHGHGGDRALRFSRFLGAGSNSRWGWLDWTSAVVEVRTSFPED